MTANSPAVIIGAKGQLGRDLAAIWPGELVGVDLPEFDATNDEQVRELLARTRPAVVLNCAAQTNVDQCEREPAAAFGANAVTALHVARAAEQVGAAIVYISTDYVFGAAGARPQSYVESDAPAPLSVYGTSKLAGEYLTAASNARHFIVRTSGLYGHAGARGKGGNFVETMLRLGIGNEGKPLRVVNDQRLSPTSTAALSARLIRLVHGAPPGIYHLAARDHCTWYEFAAEIFAHEGLTVDLQPIPSSEYPLPARRPAMSALGSQRLREAGIDPCPPWREMLHEYLRTRTAHKAQ